MGHLQEDWCDHAPSAGRACRALYDIVNDRTLLFNFRSYTVADNTDFSRLGSQLRHPNFCEATNTIIPTETSSTFEQRREVLVVHQSDTFASGQQTQTCLRRRAPRK